MITKYSDLNFDYSLDGKDAVLTDIEAIKYSLIRFLKTPIGSVPFNRTFGSSLYNLLFESTNALDPVDIQVLLYQEITTWEPRIELSPLDISIKKIDLHTYSVSCSFTIPSLNDKQNSLEAQITE